MKNSYNVEDKVKIKIKLSEANYMFYDAVIIDIKDDKYIVNINNSNNKNMTISLKDIIYKLPDYIRFYE